MLAELSSINYIENFQDIRQEAKLARFKIMQFILKEMTGECLDMRSNGTDLFFKKTYIIRENGSITNGENANSSQNVLHL